MAVHLSGIAVSGFASIRRAEVDLADLNVLIGANGAGKSNLVRVFELLGRLADGRLERFVAQAGGASTLLNGHERGPISIDLHFGTVGYRVTLAAAATDDLYFEDERVSGVDSVAILGRGHQASKLGIAAGASADSPARTQASTVLAALAGCRVFHFHDTGPAAPMKRSVPTADNVALHSNGANIAAYLLRLRDGSAVETSAYRRIAGAVRRVAPFFEDFVLQPEQSDRVRLRWREAASDTVFSAEQMSDGTLRFICLVTLLLGPDLPALVVLDEPELGLHPFAIAVLADLMRVASRRSQVIAATQSPTLVNQFGPSDLVVVERSHGGTVLRRPDVHELEGWLEDFALGELWEKNILGGGPGEAGGSLA